MSKTNQLQSILIYFFFTSVLSFGLIYKGRLICFYTYETDLGNGWENPETYNDPPEKRELALKMGANILQYAFMHP